MSATPPANGEEEKLSPQDDQHQVQEMSNDDIGIGPEFEVKEQDRWLPIANGE